MLSNPARRLRRSLWLFGAIAASALPASGQITDLPAVDGVGRFLDTRTGYVWLDFTPYYSMTYADQIAHLLPGFQPATLPQVEQLTQLSMPLTDPSAFDYYYDVVGASNTWERRIIWGNFDAVGTNGWYYAYFDQPEWSWYIPGDQGAYPDLGIWAVDVNASTVPEPTTIALLGTGLVGVLSAARRKRGLHLS